MEDYQQRRLKDVCFSTGKYTREHFGKDATVWRKPSEEFSGYLYKAQGVVEDVTNRIVDHIRPGPYRLHWDSLMTTMDIMETFEENCCVMRYTTAGQLWNIIAPREFVDFSYTTNYEDGLLTCGISLDYGETLMKSLSSFPPTSVILNKKLPYHHMDIVLESLQGPCKLRILLHTFTAKTETMSRDLP
uniref:StAR related lipid transfer domain containing 4 n=1 Tax=Anas platyrhynchos TaxID=8839 RepID=A0A8B9R297_ANAPL